MRSLEGEEGIGELVCGGCVAELQSTRAEAGHCTH